MDIIKPQLIEPRLPQWTCCTYSLYLLDVGPICDRRRRKPTVSDQDPVAGQGFLGTRLHSGSSVQWGSCERSPDLLVSMRHRALSSLLSRDTCKYLPITSPETQESQAKTNFRVHSPTSLFQPPRRRIVPIPCYPFRLGECDRALFKRDSTSYATNYARCTWLRYSYNLLSPL